MKPNKEIDAFLSGMDYAARIAENGEDFRSALNIRRMAQQTERDFYHGEKSKKQINGKWEISIQKTRENAVRVFGKISAMVQKQPPRKPIKRIS